jgi:hypothetical protein
VIFKQFLNTENGRRRGLAMELAIGVMVVASALSVLILTTSMLQNSRRLSAKETTQEKITLSEIGESFCYAVSNGDDLVQWAEGIKGYQASCNEKTLSLYDDKNELVLTVVLSDENQVTEWTYH